ncbi:MAG: Gmad2 immunoglobulin-like domain-containing protein [Patescibacteria group bacterium]
MVISITRNYRITENVGNVLEKTDLIRLELPVVKGEARGFWFFEAGFPVILTDWDGKIIGEGIAQARSDWMTENFVPFEATLNFTKPDYGKRGTLILKKDNPSGLSEHDDVLEIPINFQ